MKALNATRRAVLQMLCNKRGLAFASDLASPATLVRMQTAGLVTIQHASGGRRQNVVRITDVGRAALV